MLSPMMNEVMSSHLPGRRDDASCRASQGGLMGRVLALVHSAPLGSCTKVTESQFNHYALENTVLFKKQNEKVYRQANTETTCLETAGIRSGQEITEATTYKMYSPTHWSGLPPLLSCTIPSSKVGAAYLRNL